MNPIAIVVGVIALIGILVLIGAVKIVRPYQRGLVERLGKYKATKNPGLNLILPFIETMQLIDMREQVVDVPPQEVITQDNVVVLLDASGIANFNAKHTLWPTWRRLSQRLTDEVGEHNSGVNIQAAEVSEIDDAFEKIAGRMSGGAAA